MPLLLISACISTFATDMFEKHPNNPLLDIGKGVPVWRSIHVANISVLEPSEATGNRWMLYCRGSGRNQDGYHDTIGLLTQNSDGFDPTGLWQEHSDNPILSYGAAGEHDELHLLDTAALVGENNRILIYYKSVDFNDRKGLCVATSRGGAHFVKHEQPLLRNTGICDVIYHENRFYLFRGQIVNPDSSFSEQPRLHMILNVSGSHDAFDIKPNKVALENGESGAYDHRCVYGAKIFQAGDDPRWFMLYQTSAKWMDYPDRFHVAWSKNLTQWEKVNNPKPLLRRGEAGTWDQGGIWTGSVIEYNDKLYVFYEGWGAKRDVHNRDEPYFKGGNSRVGIASVSVVDFLNWVNGVEKTD